MMTSRRGETCPLIDIFSIFFSVCVYPTFAASFIASTHFINHIQSKHNSNEIVDPNKIRLHHWYSVFIRATRHS